jgi:Fe-S-cluster containining protein
MNTGETALRTFATGYQSGRSFEQSNRIMHHLNQLVDRHIGDYHKELIKPVACKAGCNYCCHSRPVATMPEILYLFDGIQKTFSRPEIEGLIQRIEEFEIAGSKAKFQRTTPMPCPLLVNGLCSAYEYRPILCRMMASTDANLCRAIVEDPSHAFGPEGLVEQTQIGAMAHQGIRQAMNATRSPDNLYVMTLALKMLLAEPDLVSQVQEGLVALPAARDETSMSFPVEPGDVHGQTVSAPELSALRAARTAAEIVAAMPSLNLKDPRQALATLALPQVYESQDELLENRARFDKALDDLIETKFDPVEAFTAIGGHEVFELAYQGLSVKEALAKQGNWMCDIAAKALPHLATPIVTKRKPGKLRVGYIGFRLRNNNATNWSLGWLENHGPDIETYAFLTGDVADHVTNHFRLKANHFYWLKGNVQKAAEFIKSHDLDVLIHPGLGMEGVDYQYASLRLARVQCTAWGHPVTSGLPSIDYYISSDMMEPADAASEYTEKLVRLPRTGLCIRDFQNPARETSRQELGLPEGPYVFMAQRLSKWIPARDHLFKEIHERTGWPIVMTYTSPVMERRMQKLGIEHRILGFLHAEDHLRVMQMAQVCIDPVDWSGGNTTISALAMGVPVVTLPGPYMRGRHTYAFLKLAGGEGLIAKDDKEFVEIASSVDRHRSPMEHLNPSVLYEDKAVVASLDAFMKDAIGQI